MREGRPSLTALGVALLRGAATGPRSRFAVDDPITSSLLPFPVSLLSAIAGRVQPLARLVSAGLLDHVALRTAAIDAELDVALERGIDQLVILGAGLDARAYRMDALADATVFEVDVEPTQRVKRERLARRAPRAREVRFVAVDFAEGELDVALERAGHDRDRPSAWIWEGVTPYLPIAAARATLLTIASRSPPGSVLLVTYLTPEHLRAPAILVPPVKRAFELLGEPLIGELSTAAMHALLASTGFDVDRDRGSPDWARAHLRRGRLFLEITERLVTAHRSPAGAGPRLPRSDLPTQGRAPAPPAPCPAPRR